MKKNIIIKLLLVAVIMCSCNSEDFTEIEKVSFTKIQKVLNKKEVFSEKEKRYILKKFGTVENYYTFLTYNMNNIDEIRNQSRNKRLEKNSLQARVLTATADDRLFRYNVYLVLPDGSTRRVWQWIWGDHTILESAEDAGIELPYAERAGSSSVCVARIMDGSISQPDQNFLDEDEMEKGFLLTCVAYATSDCRILTHQEDNLYGGN